MTDDRNQTTPVKFASLLIDMNFTGQADSR
jgi:hypothetical protein